MPPQSTTKVITIKVDTKGAPELRAISKEMAEMNRSTKLLSSSFSSLKNIALGYFGTIGVSAIVNMSDEMQNLSNRLKIVTKAGEDTKDVMAGILSVANDTNQSITNVAEVYNRLGSSLKSANASSESLLSLTKTLVNTFRLAGSTGNETAATIIQLSQAFSSGTLRGQELRSVLLQNAELARLLRERFGPDLAKKAEAGLVKVTDVLEILRDNMERINTSAKQLTPTFEQVLTKAFNNAKVAVGNLNEEFKLSTKFGVVVEYLTVNIEALFKAVFNLGQILAKGLDLNAVIVSSIALLAVVNPLAAGFISLGAAILYVSGSVGGFIDDIRALTGFLFYLKAVVLELIFEVDKGLSKVLFKVGLGTKGIIEDLASDLDEINRLKDLAFDFATPKYTAKPGASAFESTTKSFNDLISSLNKLQGGTILKAKDEMALLNKEFVRGEIGAREYGQKLNEIELRKLNKEFSEGKLNLQSYQDKLSSIEIGKLNRQVEQGTLSLYEFNKQVSEIKIDELNSKFQQGVITLQQYDMELAKISQKFSPTGSLRAGTEEYLQSIGTTSSQVADAVKSAFGSLETFFNDFIKTGKLNFKEFTQSILDDIQRIIVRSAIVQPLAQGILGAVGVGSSGTTGAQVGSQYSNTGGMYAAKGAAFSGGNVIAFARGGIVDSPTSFGYGSSKTGIMGEAGPEAILPLSRGSGGDLGIKAAVTPVTINIINNADVSVDSKESTGPNGERMIDMIISAKVKEGLAAGTYDKAMQQSYGLFRKGS